MNSAIDVLLIRLERLRRKHGRVAGKEHHIEEIRRTEFADQILEQSLRRVQREAFHRARDVNNEDVLTRRNRVGCNALRRLGHVEKEVLVGALEEQET